MVADRQLIDARSRLSKPRRDLGLEAKPVGAQWKALEQVGGDHLVGGRRQVALWVLVGLNGEQAQIRLGDGAIVSATIGALSRLWTGDYLLLWRPPTEFSRELRLGVRGDDVRWLRGKLSSLGWDTSGTADPLSFDDGLQEAVRRFQRRQGLAVDGIAGPRTVLQVNAALGETDAPTIQ